MVTKLDSWVAGIAMWAFFALGVILVFEVVARYFFNAPTIWVEEVARLLFVWSVFGGAAFLFQDGAHISVTIVTDNLGRPAQRFFYLISLLFVAVCAGVTLYASAPILVSSLSSGKTTGSMLDLPAWPFDLALPVAMLLVVVRTVAEFVKCLGGGGLPQHSEPQEH
ncbi:TRAP transporter small permease [Roseovarius sp. CAU 1744]|uniref:TRAP transporter small permease n=1 Tax=Roseovarius sp. CAU 1744 TaxID=3140368 RepID=UPI00325AB5D1